MIRFICSFLLVGGPVQVRVVTEEQDAAWSVVVPEGRFKMPKGQVIADQESWQAARVALHHPREVPAVDFGKHLVYVDSVGTTDKNSQSLTFYASDRGTLYVECSSTLVYYGPSGSDSLDFYLIPRNGIRGILCHDRTRQCHVAVPLE